MLIHFVASCCLLLACPGASDQPLFSPATPGTFSIAVLPDTQTYTADQPEVFQSQTHWIAQNLDRQNIAFVTHTGDIVERHQSDKQWRRARDAMDAIHGLVPYGLCVGNRDMKNDTGDASKFSRYFGRNRFAGFDWIGGDLNDNANSYQLFTAAGMDFIILHIECNARDDALDWANQVLEDHATRRAIISTHMYLGPITKADTDNPRPARALGRMQWKKCHGARGNTPEQMWSKCFSLHANIFLVLCGDQSRVQAMRQTSTGAQGNRVHEVLADYSKGYMRLLRFIPSDNRIDVRTFSPWIRELHDGGDTVPDIGEHQFSLPYPMPD